MIETLYTNGCSWTFGAELEQDPAFAEYITSCGWHMQDPTNELNWSLVDNNGMIMSTLDLQYDLFNWPGCLKTISGAKTLINHGLGGGSNTRILRTTLDFIKQLKPSQYNKTLIVIGWTISERDEILINKTWQRWNIVQPFSQTVDREVIKDEKYISALDRHQQDYASLVFDDYANILKYFNSVYMLSNTLNNLGIKHYFFNALPAWWEGGEYKTDVNVQEEFGRELEWHENQKNIQNFRDSFMHYVQINDLPTGKYLHPLHTAHTAWANYICTDMKSRGIIS
jgi:hypothetical protein